MHGRLPKKKKKSFFRILKTWDFLSLRKWDQFKNNEEYKTYIFQYFFEGSGGSESWILLEF